MNSGLGIAAVVCQPLQSSIPVKERAVEIIFSATSAVGAGIGLKSAPPAGGHSRKVKVLLRWPTFAAWRCNVRMHTRRHGEICTYPGTVMIEAIHTIIAQAAVRGARRPEDLAGEAVLQLNRLALDEHLLGAGRRPVCGTVQ